MPFSDSKKVYQTDTSEAYQGQSFPHAYSVHTVQDDATNIHYGQYSSYAFATGQAPLKKKKKKHLVRKIIQTYFTICGIVLHLFFLAQLVVLLLVEAKKWMP